MSIYGLGLSILIISLMVLWSQTPYSVSCNFLNDNIDTYLDVNIRIIQTRHRSHTNLHTNVTTKYNVRLYRYQLTPKWRRKSLSI